MAKNNFFDKFWKPYLEYTADLGFGDEQTRQEILDLKIESGDYVANIGINWGTSIKFIFDVCPEVKKVIGIDSSNTMFSLSKAVFSNTEEELENWYEGLSEKSIDYLRNLHRSVKQNSNKVYLILCSAKKLHEKKLIFDKIAATMGMHWLEETKSEAFLSMNRSLKLDGLITFSTSSAYYKVQESEKCFYLNPLYQEFFKRLNQIYNKNSDKPEEKIRKITLDQVVDTIDQTGFKLESHREFRIEILPDQIDRVILAGIKFRHPMEKNQDAIKQTGIEILQNLRKEIDYKSHNQKFEICPIFRIRKIKNY